METDKKIVGKCPVCGGDVVKTLKGYTCVNALQENPSCQFILYNAISNRRLSDSEAADFLANKKILLDGFASKEGKNYSGILTFNQDGTVAIGYVIGTCPKCGGSLYVNARSISCGNYKDPEKQCKFTIWRNTGGHDFSLQEIEQILSSGKTEQQVETFDGKGVCSMHHFGLDADKNLVKL